MRARSAPNDPFQFNIAANDGAARNGAEMRVASYARRRSCGGLPHGQGDEAGKRARDGAHNPGNLSDLRRREGCAAGGCISS